MQRLTYVLYQMDEALRQIGGGHVEQLRLALLLLDNAAELQVERRVRQERSSEDLRERIRSRIELIVAHDESAKALLGREMILKWTPLTKSQKKDIDREFGKKLDYLVERCGVLDPRLAQVISYIHRRYRNEAYHEGRVRRETIRTAALILFEANCQLLLSVFRIAMWSSSEDYSWVTARFGIERPAAMLGDDLTDIVDQLREGAMPTLDDVVGVLGDHLRSRADDILEALDFVAENTTLTDRGMALRVAQRDDDEVSSETTPDEWTVAKLQDLYKATREIATATDRLDAFSRFSALEERLEPIEREVGELASEVDQAMQYEVDRARGK